MRKATIQDFINWLAKEGYKQITPETFAWERGSITFIYIDPQIAKDNPAGHGGDSLGLELYKKTNNRVVYGAQGETHANLAEKYGLQGSRIGSSDSALFGRVSHPDWIWRNFATSSSEWAVPEAKGFLKWCEDNQIDHGAFAREMRGYRISAYWSDPKRWAASTRYLKEAGVIDGKTILLSPMGDAKLAFTQGSVNDQQPQAQQDPQAAQRIAKQQQLHLMRGDEKKRAMQDLGLHTTTQAPKGRSAWDAALRNKGYSSMGESFRQFIKASGDIGQWVIR